MRRFLLLLTVPFLLNGCIAALVAGGTETGVTLAEDRSVGRKVDDTVIYTDITHQFLENDASKLITYVTFNIRYGRVMLTGIVPSDADAQRAVALTWKGKGVQEVINELVVSADRSYLNIANDSLIKRNLESRLLITKDVWVINYSMDVTNGVAYLIGRVKDQAEMNRVLNVARSTKGVKRVVTHLQIGADSTMATPAPASMPANNGSYAPSYPGSAPVSSSDTSGTVDAPGSISSGDLAAPAAR